MEKGPLDLPELSERTITLSWARAKDTLFLGMAALLGTLGLNALNGVREAVEKINDKVSTVMSVQAAQTSHAQAQDGRVTALEERQTYLEREVFRVEPHH
jgi:hypothetical protein